MEQRKRAWVYCRIDAPEDNNGCLKEQKKELFDYANQMNFDVVGSTQDTGYRFEFMPSGLCNVLKVAEKGEFEILILKQINYMGREKDKTLKIITELNSIGIKAYSPLEGEIIFSK